MDTKKLRQKILDLAIRGKLVPQDPNDEPASVLLERIQAEKEQLIKNGEIKRSKKSASSDTYPYENVPFEIPESWVWTTLGNIGQWQSGATPSRLCKKYYGGTIPWLKTGDLNDGYIYDIPEYITEKALAETSVKLNPVGSILIAMYGATIGKVGMLTFPATTNQACCACVDYSGIEQKYLFYFLVSHKEEFIMQGGGGAQPNISKEKIVETLIPIPPRPEQVRIVNIIENWFAIIDKIEQEQVDLTCAIKQTKSKILDIAIHGKLVPQDPNDEPAIELLRRINPSFKPCDNAHYKNLPSGWSICRLEDIVDYEQPQAYIVDSTNYSEDYTTPVLTAGKSFIIGYTNETDGIFDNLPVIIFDDFTTDSRFVDFPFKVKSSAMKILRVKKEIDIRYVGFYMIITRLVGDTHKRYWISEYSKLPIPIPPKAEQERIVQTVTDLLGKLDNIIAEL
ncbi:restriction endonuclease subunit S [uncultured Alistipes sp.]|uniref:restriction endonuclease subunit S n=3 Tax=uncultured Alistipes sp. TaxID=538949 RepID=UPI0027306C0B|nr:restriction endonuclease subunit S [uncultured Alistipes sp.]